MSITISNAFEFPCNFVSGSFSDDEKTISAKSYGSHTQNSTLFMLCFFIMESSNECF